MKKADVYQTVTNNILAAMENGIIPWRKPFKTSFSPIPINFSTGKVYRGINVFLLNLACLQYGYPKNAWLTFRQAKQMGGFVKKGQSSETILFWKSTLINEKNLSQEEESQLIKKVYIARIYNVFNIDQCEGIIEAKRSDKIRYSKEELIAEMGASFLCAFTGIENPDLTNNSAAYLQSWLQVFKWDSNQPKKSNERFTKSNPQDRIA